MHIYSDATRRSRARAAYSRAFGSDRRGDLSEPAAFVRLPVDTRDEEVLEAGAGRRVQLVADETGETLLRRCVREGAERELRRSETEVGQRVRSQHPLPSPGWAPPPATTRARARGRSLLGKGARAQRRLAADEEVPELIRVEGSRLHAQQVARGAVTSALWPVALSSSSRRSFET